jgi:hypothetical protein
MPPLTKAPDLPANSAAPAASAGRSRLAASLPARAGSDLNYDRRTRRNPGRPHYDGPGLRHTSILYKSRRPDRRPATEESCGRVECLAGSSRTDPRSGGTDH